MKLWTIQNIKVLEDLKKRGELVCLNNVYSKDWDLEYLWMSNQMKKRIGKPKLKNQYPIWAWYQYNNENQKKPDLRRSAYLPSKTKGVRIEFVKKNSEVLLSDFILWHYPLCYKSYIGESEKSTLKFENDLIKADLENVIFDELPISIKKEIENSWQRIFDMDFKNKFYTYEKSKKMIQATVWEIKESEILKIEEFTAR